MFQASVVTLDSPYQALDKESVSPLHARSCGDDGLFAQWGWLKSQACGGPISVIVQGIRNVKTPIPPVHFYLIEGGSIFAIVGGLISYVSGDRLVGGGGLLVGIAGVITALTPIIQGWLSGMREERKQKMERHVIANRVHGNQFSIELMKAELDDLRRGTAFKRELIEKQQVLIEYLVKKVAKIESETGLVVSDSDKSAAMLLEQNRTLLDIERSSSCNVESPPSGPRN